MLTKKGKTFPKNGGLRIDKTRYAADISKALRNEVGGSHRAVKTIKGWTCASDRTIKNWLAGTNGPNGAHLIELLRHSDEVCCVVLRLAGREAVLAALQLGELRVHLLTFVAEIERLQDK